MGNKYSQGKAYKVVACVLAGFSNDEEWRTICRIIPVAKEHGCRVVFFSSISDFYNHTINDEGEKKIFEVISVERFDAIILFSETFKQDEDQIEMTRRARRAGVPVIAIEKHMDDCVNMVYNYGDTFKEIVRHMVEHHGYRRINFMAGMRNNSFSDERIQAFREVLEENGLPFEEDRIYYGDFWFLPTEQEMERMMAKDEPLPEAIICANDSMAITVCSYLQERGIRIPEDVAVSGFDGMEMEQYCRPRLTTGICDMEKMLERIFEIVLSPNPDSYLGEPVQIYNRMQVGGSCGCPYKQEQNVAAQMIKLKSDLYRQIEYQNKASQIVANYGTRDNLNEVYAVLPFYLRRAAYTEFWFCANEDFAEAGKIRLHPEKTVFDKEHPHFANVMDVIRCRPIGEEGEEESLGKMNFGDLLPDLDGVFDWCDFIMIVMIPLNGKPVGYTAITFNPEVFWATAYSAFLTNLRHLLEMQRSHMKLMKMYACDQLTGLYNRNGFYQRIEQMLAESEDKSLAIISMDMDGLKQVNDTWGHAMGDTALLALGRIIRECIDEEIAARIGGDEFLVAFTGDDVGGRMEELVKRMKEKVAEFNVQTPQPFELCASIGAYANSIKGHTLDYFLKKADNLMYEVKARHKMERGLLQQ